MTNQPHELLTEAAKVVEERADAYEGDYYATAVLWSSMLGVELSGLDVLRMMILLKMARTINSPGHVDSWLDIAGYASLGPKVFSEMTEEAPEVESTLFDTDWEEEVPTAPTVTEDPEEDSGRTPPVKVRRKL